MILAFGVSVELEGARELRIESLLLFAAIVISPVAAYTALFLVEVLPMRDGALIHKVPLFVELPPVIVGL